MEYEIIKSEFKLVENYMTFGEFEEHMDEAQEEDFTESDRDLMFNDRDCRTFNKIYYGYDN